MNLRDLVIFVGALQVAVVAVVFVWALAITARYQLNHMPEIVHDEVARIVASEARK